MAACENDEWRRRAALRRFRVGQRDPLVRLTRSEPPAPPAPRTDPDQRGETRSHSLPGPAQPGPRRSGKEPPGGRSPERSHAREYDTDYSRDDARPSRCRPSASPEHVRFESCSTCTARRCPPRRQCDPALPDSGAHGGPPLCPSERRWCPESGRGWAHRTLDHYIAGQPPDDGILRSVAGPPKQAPLVPRADSVLGPVDRIRTQRLRPRLRSRHARGGSDRGHRASCVDRATSRARVRHPILIVGRDTRRLGPTGHRRRSLGLRAERIPGLRAPAFVAAQWQRSPIHTCPTRPRERAICGNGVATGGPDTARHSFAWLG